MQTFQRNWWFLFKWPDKHKFVVPFAGEFHCRFHIQDADDIMNKMHLYFPIFMHFGIKSLGGCKILMKMQARRETWTLLILSSVLAYLSQIYTPDELSDIPTLLRKVSKNLPVYHLVGWAYYHGGFIWGCKKAVRVGDSEFLDFMWHYSLLMYGVTNKNQYKKGCLQVMKVLHDSEANVRMILDDFRTYRECLGFCNGGELDMMIERVSYPNRNPNPNLTLIQTNPNWDINIFIVLEVLIYY